ncbi:MAG TPA: metal ABC transporter substrate-binding protein [Candidatus Eremiobacteraceae bacterium]|nr:metal ABC transporter substrate-binding protein [Candidatus Eremiobacteraceae bacterium]
MILDKVRPYAASGALAFAVLCAGCSSQKPAAEPSPAGSRRVQAAATISTIQALAQAVGGDKADVISIVPIGASPETYDPSPQDLVALANAQLIIKNGAGLELWLDKVLRNVAKPGTKVIVLSDGMPVEGAKAAGEPGNPHLWLDVTYAQVYVHKIAAALRDVDPPNAAYYSANETRETARLRALDAWIREQIATIPQANRTMLTFHDAWYYFDQRYGLRDIGAIEPSPGQQPSAAYLSALIAQARANHVRAVFAEPQFSPKLAQALATSAGIKTVSDLYDDTLGTTPQLQTYEGMMHYDVDTIVQALR